MKTEFLIIFILSLILNHSKSYIDSSKYSKLLGKVRKEIVEQALLNLPEKDNVNALEMFNQMADVQEKYSLTEVDSAYLIYKWIAINIQLELTGKNEDPPSVYNSGKGTGKGMSSLFKKMCDYLKIEADTISGYLKTSGVDSENIITNIEFTWNYVLIDGEYYLIDVSLGTGFFELTYFTRFYNDFFFGTNPEIFIRHHFPKENKWQLLPKPLSLVEFNSQAYLLYLFYLNGLKTISPDTNIIAGNGLSNIILTYDDSISEILTMVTTEDTTNPYNSASIHGKISNGQIDLVFLLKDVNHNLLSIWVHDYSWESYMPVAYIKLQVINEN